MQMSLVYSNGAFFQFGIWLEMLCSGVIVSSPMLFIDLTLFLTLILDLFIEAC